MDLVFVRGLRIIITLAILHCTGSCAVIYNFPSVDDHRIFPCRVVQNDPDQVFRFHQAAFDHDLGNGIMVNYEFLLPNSSRLVDYLEDSKTLSFLIIRNDTLIYKWFDNDYCDSSLFNLFSVTKAYITTLVGIAIREGSIRDVDQRVVEFLPELEKKEGFDRIRIRHLLTHTSGIRFSDVKYSPFSDNARYYYGKHLRKQVMKAELYCPPGQEIHYSSINCQLLVMLLERATGSTLSSYLEKHLWKCLGMEYCATWSTDSKGKDAIEKGFSCLNCTAIDLAKLGRLYMNQGNWEGKQILPREYARQAICRDTTCGSSWNYQFNFQRGPEKYGSFFSRGLYGQLLYMYPEKNVIIVRTGESHLGYKPDFINTNIVRILDQL